MLPKVTVYFGPDCAECRRVLEYLQRKRIPFVKLDGSRDREAREYLRRINTSRVPVVRVGEEHVIGFDETRLDALIRTSESVDVAV
jgi:glutaredoxin